MIYAAKGEGTEILEDFSGYADAKEWAEFYEFLTGRKAWVLRRHEDDVIYELVRGLR